jgi:predicted enzyme related to lactoylglutathione lyase
VEGDTTKEEGMPNPVTWFEVLGKDGTALQRFYSELFGWELNVVPDFDYGMMQSPERGIGGGIGQAQQGDGYVTVYAEVDDPQAYLDKAEQLGGKTVVPVTEMEMVTFALFTDPEGHVFGLAKSSGEAS